MSGRRTCLFLVALCVGSGCSMTPDGDPLRPRFLNPELPPVDSTAPPDPAGPPLRLGWIRAAEHLRFRVVWREDEALTGFYERRRWTESPAVYLERALRRALFLESDLRRVLVEPCVTLEAELVAFEELRGDLEAARVPQVRVAVAYHLLKGEELVGEGLRVAEEPLGTLDELRACEDDAPLLARAMGRALSRAVDEVREDSREVLAALD